MTPCQPTEEVMNTLTKEMENMIIEHQLRNEGPIKSLWDVAVRRRKGVEVRLEEILKDDSQTILGQEGGLKHVEAKVGTRVKGDEDGLLDISTETVKICDEGKSPYDSFAHR
jgi:hypothetical protein